jgi:hypothetical protein
MICGGRFSSGSPSRSSIQNSNMACHNWAIGNNFGVYTWNIGTGECIAYTGAFGDVVPDYRFNGGCPSN